MFTSVRNIAARNRDAGFYFFDPSSLRFFASRIGWDSLRGGRYFVTSEQFRPASGPPAARRYTVRMARPDGSIETVGDFQAYASRSAALAAIGRILRSE